MASLYAKLPAIREVEVNLDILEGVLHVGDKSYPLEGDVRDVVDSLICEIKLLEATVERTQGSINRDKI